jgi:Peptidase A4 family
MQNQNWQFLERVVTVAAVAALVLSVTNLATAQRVSGEDRSAILAAAPRIQTSVQGVTAIAGAPKGFNPFSASNRQLLSYGLPQAPDKTAQPEAYSQWEKAMLALQACSERSQAQGRTTSPAGAAQVCQGTDVAAQPYSSTNAKSGTGVKSNIDGTSSITFTNWSGIANTNKDKTWNSKTSFDEVVSIWNVPVSDHPFGNLPCDEGPWYEVTWNGVDGFPSGGGGGDVVQGGSYIYWDGGGCGGSINYYGWVEWYPSYPILVIYCGSSPCPVSPGDDFYVVTEPASGFNEQFVFVEDETQLWYGTFGLTYKTGPGVVGSSAEYIVERPCCNGSGDPLPLNNYIWDFFDDSFAYDGAGKLFYPGSTTASTYLISMCDDACDQDISTPEGYGTAGFQGRYSIWMTDENCAYSGGCTP